MKHRLSTMTLAVLAALPGQSLLAWRAEAAVLEEIVVTARKREETQQEVPVSITVVDGEELARRGMIQFENLELANPNTRIEYGSSGAGLATTVSIRGNLQNDVATQLDPAVGVYLDGVILSRTFGTTMNMVDLQSVQTLKGPQGTLFGRNTTGGAILLTSRDPAVGQGFSGNVQAEYGELDTQGLEGAIDIPLGSNAAVRLVGKHREVDDYVEFTDGVELGRQEEDVARAKVRWEPGDSTIVRLSAETGEIEATNPLSLATQPNDPSITGNAPIAGEFLSGLIVTPVVATDEQSSVDANRYALEVAHDTDIGEIKFITGYRELDVKIQQTLPPGVGFTRQDKPDLENFTAELQYQGDFFSDRMTFTSGLYYFDEQTTEDQLTRAYEETRAVLAIFPDPLATTYMETDIESVSAYAQSTFNLTDATRLTLGGRFTSDDRSSSGTTDTFQGIVQYDNDDDESDYLLGIDHNFSDSVMLYANTSTGYRSGGANLAEDPANPGFWSFFDAENVTNYEAGMKSDWLEQQLRINLAAFYQDYENYQYTAIDVSTGIPVRNAYVTDAIISGGELEISAALPAGFTLSGTWGYIDSEIDGGANDGDSLTGIPENTASLTLGKVIDLGANTLDLRAMYNFRDEVYSSVGNYDESVTDSRELINVSATFKAGPWSIIGYVNNLLDEEYYRGITYAPGIPGLGLMGLSFTSLGEPRVAGIKVGYEF